MRRIVCALLAVVLIGDGEAAKAQATHALSTAEMQGRKLAFDLCNSRPAQNLTNSGVLLIRRADGRRVKIPVQFKIFVTDSNWRAVYQARMTSGTNGNDRLGRNDFSEVRIVHAENQPSRYLVPNGNPSPADTKRFHDLAGEQLLTPFAGSDFWLCDLGLEFFHWPGQRVLPNTTHLKRGRSYTLLESTNPHPSPGGYTRVLSWIDQETGGILEAQAFDQQGRQLKVFEPKSFEKVNGQWELQEMEIRNVQTDSSTRIEFDLQKD